AYEIYQKRNMLATPNALMTINTIALLMEKQGDYASAAQLYSKALGLLEPNRSDNGTVYGALLNNLSINYLNQNKFEDCLQYARQAMDFALKTQGQHSLSYLKSSNNALVAFSKLNRLEEGRSLGTKLAGLCRQVLGDSAELLATVYSNLSALEARQGNLPLAIQYQEQSLQIQMYRYEQNLYALSERDQVAYWQQQAYQFQLLPSLLLASRQPDAARISTMVNQQLRLKGFVLTNASALLRQARQLNNPDLQQIIDDWQATRSLYLQQSAIPAAQRQYPADSLSIRANNLEQAVNSLAGQVVAPARQAISWQQIQQALEPNEAAIEFIRFPKFGNQYYTDSLYYAAIIIRKSGPPSLVSLGSEKAVQWCLTGGRSDSREASINKLYRSSIKGKINAGPTFTGDSLFRLIWQPMQRELQGVTRVSIAPDGLLHKLAFAALPTGEGSLLADSLELHQYMSVRQIASRSKTSFRIRSAVLEGFAQFGRSPAGTEPWEALPGTEKEIRAIEQLLKEKKIPYQSNTGMDASEESLKRLNNKAPSLLHIATHGYFLPDLPHQPDNGVSGSDAVTAFAEQNPLVRSGIVLAGANQYWQQAQAVSGKDDGIISAYEMAQMNLQGTELAVLSACETGLGEVQDSEGVFGLQRALKMAGIKMMLLSLWQVPDEETKELMTLFYQELLNGTTARAAFDKARKTMRAKYPPFAWAAFVLIE
ncbi:MAG: CHAT domain-containing protein, partial [Chitinophagaceae bacterium]|nr:CHAT domain-containing protein [Chitinophagaceae bacterium]